jgi:hypothetical protein
MTKELNHRIANALEICNQMVARELGSPQRKARKRTVKAQPMPASPKLRAVNAYRKAHPNCSLREAAIAAGFNIK